MRTHANMFFAVGQEFVQLGGYIAGMLYAGVDELRGFQQWVAQACDGLPNSPVYWPAIIAREASGRPGWNLDADESQCAFERTLSLLTGYCRHNNPVELPMTAVEMLEAAVAENVIPVMAELGFTRRAWMDWRRPTGLRMRLGGGSRLVRADGAYDPWGLGSFSVHFIVGEQFGRRAYLGDLLPNAQRERFCAEHNRVAGRLAMADQLGGDPGGRLTPCLTQLTKWNDKDGMCYETASDVQQWCDLLVAVMPDLVAAAARRFGA